MSDTAVSPHPGSLSPRNIDTVSFRILAELPYPGLGSPGDRLSWWPQGETFANINGCLRPVTNGDILEWEAAGKLKREGAAPRASGVTRQSIAVHEEPVP